MHFAVNPGDRVRWAYPEPSADPSEMRGEVLHIVEVKLRVRWDDGTEETVSNDDLELDTA